MAFGYGRRRYYRNHYKRNWRRNYRKGKSKYTKAEQKAFELGQLQRIKKSLQESQNTRVYEAWNKGFNSDVKHLDKKSLF